MNAAGAAQRLPKAVIAEIVEAGFSARLGEQGLLVEDIVRLAHGVTSCGCS